MSLFSNKVGPHERYRIKGSLYDCLRWTLLIGKYSGCLPLVGFGSLETLRFTWKSVNVLICLFNIFAQMFMLSLQLYGLLHFEFELKRFNLFIYVLVCFILTVLLFRFGQKCQDFMSSVAAVEILLTPVKKPRSTARFIKRCVLFFLLLEVVEHSIFQIYLLFITDRCHAKILDDSDSFWKSYFKLLYYWYYENFPFSYVSAIIFKVIRIHGVFVRAYCDVLIMIVCIYLKNRFKDFNRLIINHKSMFTKNFKPSWSELQIHYTRISKLVMLVDQSINGLVFISYTFNVYSVCLALYFILNEFTEINVVESINCPEHHKKHVITTLYRIVNIGTMFIRTGVLSYLAAEVNVASRKSLVVLHTIPSANYDFDMRRLMSQIYYSKVGITGLNFFQITRGMLLAMVAKVLTLEMVLVQF